MLTFAENILAKDTLHTLMHYFISAILIQNLSKMNLVSQLLRWILFDNNILNINFQMSLSVVIESVNCYFHYAAHTMVFILKIYWCLYMLFYEKKISTTSLECILSTGFIKLNFTFEELIQWD